MKPVSPLLLWIMETRCYTALFSVLGFMVVLKFRLVMLILPFSPRYKRFLVLDQQFLGWLSRPVFLTVFSENEAVFSQSVQHFKQIEHICPRLVSLRSKGAIRYDSLGD